MMIDSGAHDPSDETLSDLVSRLLNEGRDVVGAEAKLWKEIARYRLSMARNGIIAVVAALFIVNAGLIAAFVAFTLALSKWLGPVGAGLVIFIAAGGIGYFLVRFGLSRLKALTGSDAEKEALAAGERKA